jgi:hypothetical protein
MRRFIFHWKEGVFVRRLYWWHAGTRWCNFYERRPNWYRLPFPQPYP